MSPSQIIVLATPVFFLLIAIEFAWGLRKRRNTYRLNDAVNSISLGMLSQVTAVLTRLFRIGIYTAVFTHVALWRDDAFWKSPVGWLLALVFYDFCYYWLHRAGHEVAVFWAAHVVHHQSQDYNLSTALRQTSSGALLGWLFYVPMAVAGVPPLVFGIVALVDLLYQFWVHTEHVGKLGWFDRWFCSPSNHRVHHAVNDEYLDRNYGGVLIVWDRMFGSFREEAGPCVYGTRAPLESWDPLWANFEVYSGLAKDSWHARNWLDKVRVWFKPPGWRPADVAARFPKPAFDLARVQRYEPPMTTPLAWFGGLQFVAVLQGVALFLWHADAMPVSQSAVWLAALAACLWAIGAAMQGRIGMLEVLVIESAALATATGALGLPDLHHVFKPLTIALAMAFVWLRMLAIRPEISVAATGTAAAGVAPTGTAATGTAVPSVTATAANTSRHSRGGGNPGLPFPTTFRTLLLAALAFSLIGDVFLMVGGFFIPGLVSFLIAHLFYIAVFRHGVPWFPSRIALACTLGAAALLYTVLFPSLGAVLKVAVLAYAV